MGKTISADNLAQALEQMMDESSPTQAAGAMKWERYKVEALHAESARLGLRVVTDTETGQRWLVAYNSKGGVQMESMGRDSITVMSGNDGE